MKAFFTTVLAIACMVVLIWGNLHWTKKTTVSGKSNDTPVVNVTKKVEEKSPSSDLIQYTKNWPAEAVKGFEKAIEEERSYKVLFVGSDALGDDQTGWAADTKKQLLEAYGEKNMDVTIQVFEQTSLGFVNEEGAAKIAGEQVDLVLFEPFTLRDNGEVAIEDSLKNVQNVMDETIEANPDTVFILMPPHPIYNATFYPKQVDALKAFAEENQIAYLDHWEAWPDPMTDEIKEYLNADQSQPNEEGHKIWAEYVTDYLISKE